MTDPASSNSEGATSPSRMGLLARLGNVFAVPGEVVDDLKGRPNTPSSWVVPVLIGCLVAAVSATILFSQDTIIREIEHLRAEKMQAEVDAGKMSQSDADQILEKTAVLASPMVLRLGWAIGGMVAIVSGVFWWAFVVWLVALLFVRRRVPYLKALEVSGLASLITTLAIVVTLLLQINMGTVTATPSLALAVADYDPSNPFHMALAAVNPLRIWMLCVLGMGLAKLAEIGFGRAALLMVACYGLQTSAVILMGAGMARL